MTEPTGACPRLPLPPVGSVPAGDLDHQSAAVQQVTDTRPSLRT
jgi:hypothetical protein